MIQHKYIGVIAQDISDNKIRVSCVQGHREVEVMTIFSHHIVDKQ